MAGATQTKGLRRLNWVRSIVVGAAGFVAPVFGQLQSVGDSVLERLGRKESLASYSTPLLEKAADIGDSALSSVDQQVDYMINTSNATVSTARKTVSDSLTGVRDIHTTNLAFLSHAFQGYLMALQRAADWAVAHLNPVRGARAAWDWVRATLAHLQELLDPDALYKFVVDRWTGFTSIPVVRGVLDTLQPITNALLSTFYALHDFVVGSGLYKFAVDTSLASWRWVQGSGPYKLGAQYLYPVVQPVADPTLDKLTRSEVINSTLDFWKPNTNIMA